MYEKVNPSHPDKIADRIAGAIVDVAYSKESDPKIAVEVLIGHGHCHIISETTVKIEPEIIEGIVGRIAGDVAVDYKEYPQDSFLNKNQRKDIRCGDNGIFRGVPLTDEQRKLSGIARSIYKKFPYDGKYVLSDRCLVICQSNDKEDVLKDMYPNALVNPLGFWTGGIDVDTGATNRKLGSDMGDSATGGGLHGKDLSKADVSINIYAWLKAQEENRVVELECAIGDYWVDGKPYKEIVEIARKFIKDIGGFEKFAEWGLF